MGDQFNAFAGWRAKYVAAILEVDNQALLHKIGDAEKAIHARLQFLRQNPNPDELAALEDAMRGLGVLRKERIS